MNDEKFKRRIICCVDTGACLDIIIKDIHEYHPNEYSDEEITNQVNQMLENNELIDRGAYLVHNYRNEK